MRKLLSHIQRINQENVILTKFSPTETCYVQSSIEENGVVATKAEIKDVSLKDRFSGLKCTDFALANVVASGAISNLRETSISGGSSVDSVEESLSVVENVIDSIPKDNPNA